MEIRAENASKPTGATDVRQQLLWIGDNPPAGDILNALNGDFDVIAHHSSDNWWDGAKASLALIDCANIGSAAALQTLVERMGRSAICGVALVDSPRLDSAGVDLPEILGDSGLIAMDMSSEPAELAGALKAMVALGPRMSHLNCRASEAETSQSEYSGRIVQMEEEMRLAARLQQDFLPSSMPRVAPVNFSVMFRPAGWVSGDIYEATRLDEQRIGFYVADAVGHGMPAALLTMFIKRALPTKRIRGDHYELVEPAEAMAELNEAICEQQLSSCQFCSAFYAMINTETLELTYSRGGHPEPVLQRSCGVVETLTAGGGLLGVFEQSDFKQGTVKCRPGDRLMIFSDGAEAVFRNERSGGRDELVAEMLACGSLGADMAALQLAGILDDRIGDEPQEDDITILIMDIDR